jgi:hypothetical protein
MKGGKPILSLWFDRKTKKTNGNYFSFQTKSLRLYVSFVFALYLFLEAIIQFCPVLNKNLRKVIN